MGEFFTAGEGDFFVQENRSEVFAHLACVGVGDLSLARGDLTPVYCPDPTQKGKFVIEGYISGEPGVNTVTLTKPLARKANFLLEVLCDFVGWVTYGCGARGDPENYLLGVLLFGMQVSNSRILAEAVAAAPDAEARVTTNADISYADRLLVYLLAFARQGVNNTAIANAIAFLSQRCEDKCGPARDLCEQGYMALDAGLYDSEIKYTINSGANWVEVTTGPFAQGGSASDVVLLETSAGHRAVFSRGTSVTATPAEVSIYENWVKVRDVDVGAVDGQTIQDLFPMAGHIWAAASGGYIYRSDTRGDTWVPLESAQETTETLNGIVMHDTEEGYAVGNNNAFLYTADGDEWNARTGPALGVDLLSVAVNDKGHVFVGAADGNLYRSEDEGVTWDDPPYEFGTGSVDVVLFDDTHRYIGLVIWNNAAGVGFAYRSKDGGASWQAPSGQTSAWNSGLNGGFMCDQNNIFVVGGVHGGTTFVAKTNTT